MAVALAGSTLPSATAEPFPPVFSLASLLPGGGGDGSAGFVLEGITANDRTGHAVAGAGDVNGDGIDDVLIGSVYASPGGRIHAGESYVVFGTAQGFPPTFELSSLRAEKGGDGSLGFVLTGVEAYDVSSFALSSVGDMNGDGIDDLLIAAVVFPAPERGEAYVVFGRDATQGEHFPAEFPLARLLPSGGGDGSLGFVVESIDIADFLDVSVGQAGDVNGDGIADLIIGAPNATPSGRYAAGESYVVFGRDVAKAGKFPAVLPLATLRPAGGGDGSVGFVLEGIDAVDLAGMQVNGAGDVNGDGVDDLIIGAKQGSHHGRHYAGESYLVFGRNAAEAGNFPAVLPLETLLPRSGGDGSTGFVLNGIDAYDYAGAFVSGAGDVNGDGVADLIIGARGADPGGREDAGQSYVVFGRETAQHGNFPAVVALASLLPAGGGDGSTGFVLNGIRAGDSYGAHGCTVRRAGDVNGDGIDDLMIGARYADPGGRENAGQRYVVFGRDTSKIGNFPASLELASLLPAGGGDGSAGFVLNGIDAHDDGRWFNPAGDVNGDGVDDLIFGARFADPGGRVDAGESYVVFGRAAEREAR